jgi:uncharacterized membrane protein
MKRYALTFLLTMLAFAAIDSLWIGFVAGPMYRATIGDILLQHFRAGPAVLFYLLQISGMMVFVVPRIAGRQTVTQNALFGALYGLFTYGCFDLTCLATIRGWTPFLAATDIAWGCVLSGAAGAIGIGAAEYVLGSRRQSHTGN